MLSSTTCTKIMQEDVSSNANVHELSYQVSKDQTFVNGWRRLAVGHNRSRHGTQSHQSDASSRPAIFGPGNFISELSASTLVPNLRSHVAKRRSHDNDDTQNLAQTDKVGKANEMFQNSSRRLALSSLPINHPPVTKLRPSVKTCICRVDETPSPSLGRQSAARKAKCGPRTLLYQDQKDSMSKIYLPWPESAYRTNSPLRRHAKGFRSPENRFEKQYMRESYEQSSFFRAPPSTTCSERSLFHTSPLSSCSGRHPCRSRKSSDVRVCSTKPALKAEPERSLSKSSPQYLSVVPNLAELLGSSAKAQQLNPLTRRRLQRSAIAGPEILSLRLNNSDALRLYANASIPLDSSRKLPRWEIWIFRILFGFLILAANIALAAAFFTVNRHRYLFVLLVFMKSKDLLSTVVDIFGLVLNILYHLVWPRPEADPKWILSLICAYAETEEQIMKTVSSLTGQELNFHKQVICIILDGQPRNVLSHFSTVRCSMTRPYTTWKCVRGELDISGGFIQSVPIILIQKKQNAGKKDSLILGHDLFNFPRQTAPECTKLLRQEFETHVLPTLIPDEQFKGFDFVFCTDADSMIHNDAIRKLADALAHDQAAIAACGVLLAELNTEKAEWSMWHLYQQFQYSFGQYVRRQAEGIWGRVTCLPGVITMIVVRSEMADAVSEYARPVAEHNLMRHQVQYLGTDRRLTWCMTSQQKHLRTLFVPDAICETIVPASLSHYLSQRRRWASNAYFNDYFYVFGKEQRLITRLFGLIDIVRLSLVFYRVFNTILFVHSLATNFYVFKIVPTLVVTKTPATWYLILIFLKEPILRKRVHKLFLGMCINQMISPILSVIVFANVILNLGSQVWGKTGFSSEPKCAVAAPPMPTTPLRPFSPTHLASLVRAAIKRTNPNKGTRALARPLPSNLREEHNRDPPQTPVPKSSVNLGKDLSTLKKRTANRPSLKLSEYTGG